MVNYYVILFKFIFCVLLYQCKCHPTYSDSVNNCNPKNAECRSCGWLFDLRFIFMYKLGYLSNLTFFLQRSNVKCIRYLNVWNDRGPKNDLKLAKTIMMKRAQHFGRVERKVHWKINYWKKRIKMWQRMWYSSSETACLYRNTIHVLLIRFTNNWNSINRFTFVYFSTNQNINGCTHLLRSKSW